MYFAINFFTSFTITGIGCYLIDIFYPSLRVKKETKEKIKKEYKHMLPTVITNLIIGCYFFIRTEIYLKDKWNDNYLLKNLFIWYLTTDVIFYINHRILHHRKLYFLHSKHHEYKYTYGIGAIYASVFDFIFTNIIPVITAPILFYMPSAHVHIIIPLATFQTVVISHGGFNLFSREHLAHHLFMNKNYGLGIVDRLLLTQK